eukprot:CAMPEP_0113323166 /NCGR_PEP_ID=MMETSP0010_2-20120614/16101_1 /TAXON_ID=216773 ORGANISM="Corethron hystrix, Strain 308" /NCGR_SAMPLE_ID=MMETSP0010_2 /ASSEMBLY_ACC=CAM_ASM_000155 /LENGTH=307 /DNA_ID=CAMNT_0000181929 /DNA_START=261 /DNA_END=1180 /DNA_ORIENTATION=+ /assembly_acc=CAM_ASM_000155
MAVNFHNLKPIHMAQIGEEVQTENSIGKINDLNIMRVKEKENFDFKIDGKHDDYAFSGPFHEEILKKWMKGKVAKVVESLPNNDFFSVKHDSFSWLENDDSVYFGPSSVVEHWLTKNEVCDINEKDIEPEKQVESMKLDIKKTRQPQNMLNAITSFDYPEDEKIMKYVEPFCGMIFSVHQNEAQNINSCDFDNEEPDPSGENDMHIDLDVINEVKSSGVLNDSVAEQSDTSNDISMLFKFDSHVYYILTELVEDELGLVHAHHPDYAYSPAVLPPVIEENLFRKKTKERPDSLFQRSTESKNPIERT